MPSGQANAVCCDRCTGLKGSGLASSGATDSGPTDSGPRGSGPISPGLTGATGYDPAGRMAANTAMVARRRLLKAAVFRAPNNQPGTEPVGPDAESGRGPLSSEPGNMSAGFADVSQLQRTVSGTVLDASPHVLILGAAGSDQRFTLTADAVAWRGTQLEPAALHRGDRVVVRLHPSSRQVADRIWANIGRVTGIITERSGSSLLVDEGATRKPQVITIQPRAVGRIQVRFPTLEPGFLVDIIGLRRDGELDGMIPATSQPAYPAHRLPAPPLVSGHVPDSISGSATWHEPREEPPGILGVAYPALDPETGCADDAAFGQHYGYSRMPYLAIGSVLRIKNNCTGKDCLVSVTGCASIARLFNDRCVTCGTSPRGRIADLTLASFIALGGELERGCFNATITIGK
jgi:hypothetical protein